MSALEETQLNLPCKEEEAHRSFLLKRAQPLRRVLSETLSTLSADLQRTAMEDGEPEMIRCECCGMSEECTPSYISGVKEFFCRRWICGLCSEAVKELMRKTPAVPVRAALENHLTACADFNATVRVNPKLSYASSMREIARRSSSRRRRSSAELLPPPAKPAVPRTSGCASAIGPKVPELQGKEVFQPLMFDQQV